MVGLIVRFASNIKQLLNAAHRVAFVVEKAIDPPGELDIRGTVIAAIAGSLHWSQLREAIFPITQDVLGDAELLRQFTNRQKSAGVLLSGCRQALALRNPVAHDLACAECHHPPRSDRHFDARFGVSADALSLIA